MDNDEPKRPSPEALLAKIKGSDRPRLRVYIGAAPGVGKTCKMLEDAHETRSRGIDVVIGFIDTHGRAETQALIGDLEIIPRKRIEYKGVTLEEMDLDVIIRRHPQVALVDELAHTNPPGMKHRKRYEDVLELLENGISVVTAVNVQHIESLNEVVASITGVRVHETVPDWFFKRADEVVNVDVSIETLRTRIQQGKIYNSDRIEQALNNFFRKGNLSALRELALRQVAEDQEAKASDYREREDLDQAPIPERVMVCMSSHGNAQKLLRLGARIAGRFARDWYAIYVETPEEEPGRIKYEDYASLQENMSLARELGAQVVKLRAKSRRHITDSLIEFARTHAITHVIFGQSARSRVDILLRGSVINRFLREVRDVTVQVVPLGNQASGGNTAS
jgi:two-component system sensor histidine kinase KdpD